MAKELGHALQQDERFIKLQAAQAAADEDAELQGLIGEFNLKRMAINSETAKEDKDEDKLKELNAEIREVYARVMANASMAAYNEAKTAVDKIINGIGAIVNMAAQGMNPDEYEEHNCGGNCNSCGGCH
ncbi:MAG: YlbF family regulator [Clostridia bacterium]|nr:YlbF family regulator [Clostridia bacterium]